jgi:Fic family protein
MIVYELVGGTEDDQRYRVLEAQNLVRQYDFTHSLYQTSTALGQVGLSHEKLKAVNFHGIACLHRHAGQYRPHNVVITNAPHQPPEHADVPPLMEDFVRLTAEVWDRTDPIQLAALVLWRLNWVHPFVNGNGRTARAISYYTLCRKLGFWLPGRRLIPELVRENQEPYYAALRGADERYARGEINVDQLAAYLSGLLTRQLES